ncbi:hypothetical protein MPL1_10487 [Methylophaga lonarensis MPL]|uniref:DUF4440 domain-containing protein n=1 Tax=Methylophaga lonarensis MPL TaxID=1286106 RepID=M7PEP5_9GAMM|nr:SgcJ/EcaC family oxidoreductase [Methylophaga lonarensis]EMR12355.1 hypothetical protein MPL1_10487 [Methylophaga lonarensis MPL]
MWKQLVLASSLMLGVNAGLVADDHGHHHHEGHDHSMHDHDMHDHHHHHPTPEMVAEMEFDKWNQLFNQGDSQGLAALYLEDATLSPGNGEILQGREAIAGLFQGFFDAGLFNHRIEITAVNFAYEMMSAIGHWHADVVNESGETVTYTGVLQVVFVENDDLEWDIGSHIWNMSE